MLFSFLLACIERNPPVGREVVWADAETEALARRACYDCHSNETVWPWYSRIPPVSALVKSDVKRGREAMNFSEWDAPENEAWEAGEVIAEGEMPLPLYVKKHEEAQLTAEEKTALIDGFQRTLASDPPPGGEEEDDD